jgi:hypothetical protein
VRFKVIMLHNEIDGELTFKVKSSGKVQNKVQPSRESYENTESDNDMPDIDDAQEVRN